MVEMMTSVLGGAHVGPEHRPWAYTSKPSNTVSISFLFLNMGILDGVGVIFIKDSKKIVAVSNDPQAHLSSLHLLNILFHGQCQ